MNEHMTETSAYYEEQYREPIGTYTAKTFGWMFLGLLFTFLVAFTGYYTQAVFYLFAVPYLPFILLAAELFVVIFLSSRITKMSVGMARGMFFLYAAINGIVFSAYFLMYEMTSLLLVFGYTSLYFGAMALVGYFTKADLSKTRYILISGAIFLTLFWVLSIFIPLEAFERIMCFIGIGIFLGFTAYDTQKIRRYHQAFGADPEMAAKASIFSALQLYLDFINLFVYILRLAGRRRSN